MGWVLSNMGWVGVCQIWAAGFVTYGGHEGRNCSLVFVKYGLGFVKYGLGRGLSDMGGRICHIWGATRVGIGTLGFVKYGLGFVKYGAPTLVE